MREDGRPWPRHPVWGREVCSACGGNVDTEWGNVRPYCTRCVPCDDCGHANSDHLNIWPMGLDWADATCWGESVCTVCVRERDLCRQEFMAGQHCILPTGHDGAHA